MLELHLKLLLLAVKQKHESIQPLITAPNELTTGMTIADNDRFLDIDNTLIRSKG